MNQQLPVPPVGPRELPTTQAAEGLPRYAWSVEQFDRLTELGVFDEDGRIELIEGELVPMQSKGNRHERLKTKLLNWFGRRLPETLELAVELGWRPRSDVYIEPDLLICDATTSPATVSAGRVHLAIEVADTSLTYDLGRKAQLYASLGIRDYWVIDAATFETRIFRDPTSQGYVSQAIVGADELLIPLLVPALSLTLRSLDLG
jgi:Uma2 family endonuclease